MELTLDQALQKGIEAHKAGNVQEADRYYTAILKANPKHPDANHNMGVLAVSIGKVNEALPFFKTALEVNPSIAQFWLSYIDALIKLDRIPDAKAVFDQAKSKGAKGDGFDEVEMRLTGRGNDQEPPQTQVQPLIKLYTQGQHQDALTQALQLLNEFPNSVDLYNIIGATNQSLGNLDKAIKAYKKALSINPDYAEVYNNIGNTLQEKDKHTEALDAYYKSLSINPSDAVAYKNTTELLVKDKTITLSSGATSNLTANGSGIIVEAGGTDKEFKYNSTGDKFTTNIPLEVGGALSATGATTLSSTLSVTGETNLNGGLLCLI